MELNLSKLNKEQKQAVVYDKGPVLIVAGAGTGKTAVITSRFAYLVEKNKAKPEEILALTFTEKSAGEMEERIGQMLSVGYADLWISTFHSFCERILRDNGLDIGLNTDFKILNETSAWLLLRKNLDKLCLDYYKPISNPSKFIRILVSHFSKCKDQQILPNDYIKYAKNEKQDKQRIAEVAQAYKKYQELVLKNGYLDFGDLINYTIELFKKRPFILEKYRKQFKYIMVDEFQDTNLAQYELLKMISAPKNNLTVTGDDDQAIYRWRGASFGNFSQFNKDFPKAKQIVLSKNYRTFQNILDLSYKFIQKNNPNRLEAIKKINKKLKARNKGKGLVEYLYFEKQEQEATGVANKIINILKSDKNSDFNDFAVLIRANNQAEQFSRTFLRAEIPFQFMAQKGLFLKPAILDIISYFKLLDNYHESSAVFRILNLPFLKTLPEDIAKITNYSHKKFKPVFEALKEISLIEDISQKTAKTIDKILLLIEKHSKMSLQKNVSEVALAFLQDSGYLEYLAKEEKNEEIEQVSQFYAKIKKFEEENLDPKLKNFMEELTFEIESGEQGKLNFDLNQGPETVKIMTLHSAKGLEFKYVFLVNLVDRRFPSIERAEQIEIPEKLVKDIISEGDAHLEEERRLFYVGMTRAKKGLFFTFAEDYGGERKRKASRFLEEIGYNAKISNSKFQIQNTKIQKIKSKHKEFLPEHFSFTQLINFKTCPLQYKFNHILKIPVKSKPSFSYGKTMHKTLFDFLSQSVKKHSHILKNVRMLSYKDLIDIYNKNWIDEWYENKKQRNQYYNNGKKSLKIFYDNFKKQKPEILFINEKPALEQSFNFKIKNYKIFGKIDRIDRIGRKGDPVKNSQLAGDIFNGGVEIIDYKTGTGKEKLKPENKTQLIIYQIALKEVFGLNPQKLTFYYLDQGKTISFLASDKEIEKEKAKIVLIIEQIKNSDFKAKPGRYCLWCDFNSICEFKNM